MRVAQALGVSTFRTPHFAAWLTPFALACSSASTELPTARVADSGVDRPNDGGADPIDAATIPDECGLGRWPERVTVRAGGRLDLAIPEEVPVEALELSLPDRWRSTITPDRRLTVRTSTAIGRRHLVVQRSCPNDHRQATIEVEVEPVFWSTLGSWNPSVDPPGFQQLPELWVDPNFGARVLLFGGYSEDNYPRELWSYSLERSVWERRAGPEVIPEHTSGRAAPLREGGGVLFLDGFSGWPGFGTTFTLARMEYGDEGVRWTRLEVADAPVMASYGGAFVLDRATGRYLSVCGLTDDGPHCQVGAFDPVSQRWSWPLVEGEAPIGRYGFAHTFDEETRRLVIFSGAGEPGPADPVNALGGTWTLELEPELRWVRLPTTNEPPPRRNACAALDPNGHRLIVWGGSADASSIVSGVWSLDLDRGHEAWTELEVPFEPPPRSSCAGAADPERRRVLFGFGNTREEVYFDLHALNL